MRAAPWDAGWEVRGGAPADHKFHTMLRSRADHRGQVCISTHQYHPDLLLPASGRPLMQHTPEAWFRRVKEETTDVDLQTGLGHIVYHRINAETEPVALRAVHWSTENASHNGFRVPNSGERAASFGMK
eukprot:14078200-Heterocapsa_arctica.AAC.1